MPVLVVGAQNAVGSAAVRSLLQTGGEVRAYCDAASANDEDARALRTRGAKAAVGDLDDEAHLELALEQVHTAMHLAADPFADADELLDAAATTVSAALGAGVRRLVLLSEVAVAAPEGNAYLEALQAAEELFEAAPLESVVVRTALRYGPGDRLTKALAAAAGAQELATSPHEPLHIDELADALRAVDRPRTTSVHMHLLVELVGPEVCPLQEFAAKLREAQHPVPPAALPSVAEDWLARPGIGGPRALGRSGLGVAAGLRTL